MYVASPQKAKLGVFHSGYQALKGLVTSAFNQPFTQQRKLLQHKLYFSVLKRQKLIQLK